MKQKQNKLKRKTPISGKRGVGLRVGKQKKKLVLGSVIRNGEQVRLEGVVADLNQTRNNLGVTIQRQADVLKIKNGQLRSGAEKQIWAKERIHILTKAMESISDGIFIIASQKPDYPVIYANQSFQKMTGYTKREILGRSYFSLYGTDADPHVFEKTKKIIHQGKFIFGQIINFQKNGKSYSTLLRVSPLRDSNSAVTHYVGILTDVTLLRAKEIEIDEQREELLHVTRVGKLAEFVSSLAHEISQPLAAILSYAQAGQRMLANREPEIKKILSYIIDDDKRAADVIHRLRSLLKKNKPELKPLDINALVNETVMLIATAASIRKDVLKIDLERDLSRVNGDRIQLQQVLLNLISNSFDALEGSKGPREILIRTSQKDAETIVVEVKDTGCGIPKQNLQKLFARFFTSKPDGLGMGLSISRSIVEAHGGALGVKNNPDRGAAFYFTIPVVNKGA